MSKAKFPKFSIPDLHSETNGKNLLTVERFGKYLSGNPHLAGAHTHSFYHLVYFTRGKGRQVIDFTSYPVQPGIIYFMSPGQVHQWLFDGEVDGYIINFSPTFFEQQGIHSKVLQQFYFFSGDPVLLLSKATQKDVQSIFETMLSENQQQKQNANLVMASQLVQLFVMVERNDVKGKSAVAESRHLHQFRKFIQLVETEYKNKRLPKEYAPLLFITTHQLNVISHEIAGISSGEVIRNRVVLEAKRLLVNLHLSIEEIADELHFEDSSYFIRFFKKYTGQTPESFRKQTI